MALKISKDRFVSTINAIQAGVEKRNEFNKAMEKFSSSYYTTTVGDEWLLSLLGLLSDCVGDEYIKGIGTTIEWFLFENSKKEIKIRENFKDENSPTITIDVSTPEKLYDYFERYGTLS